MVCTVNGFFRQAPALCNDPSCNCVHTLPGTLQVPFGWFVPLMSLEVGCCIYGSIVHGLQPRYWVWVRYPAALLLAVVVSAVSSVQSRQHFMNGRRPSRPKEPAQPKRQ